MATLQPTALAIRTHHHGAMTHKHEHYKNQVQDQDPKLWNRARQIAWIRANYRKRYWLTWTTGDTGWTTGTPAVALIESGAAKLLHL